MALSALTSSGLRASTWCALGLPDAPTSPDSAVEPTVLAAAVRRAAGTLCPCSSRTLVIAVADALQGLGPAEFDLAVAVKAAVERAVAYGDLVELATPDEPGGPHRRLLYAAPPAFVQRPSGDIYLLGVTPDRSSPLPPTVEADVQADGATRRMLDPPRDVAEALLAFGLVQLPDAVWLWTPPPESADRHIARFDAALDAQAPVSGVSIDRLLDGETDPDRYRRRWAEPGLSHVGRYLVRRPQLYGSDLWAYAELDAGRVTRLLDLPVRFDKHAPPDVRACDQAWRLQAALDSVRDRPQRLRLSGSPDGSVALDLFAPPPAWLARRWNVLGRPHPRAEGALFSFVLPRTEAEVEADLARSALWLSDAP